MEWPPVIKYLLKIISSQQKLIYYCLRHTRIDIVRFIYEQHILLHTYLRIYMVQRRKACGASYNIYYIYILCISPGNVHDQLKQLCRRRQQQRHSYIYAICESFYNRNDDQVIIGQFNSSKQKKKNCGKNAVEKR